MQATTFVGLDVHKRWINAAVLLSANDTPVEWRIANEAPAIRKMLKRVAELAPGDDRYCYEAGPCGYALQRQIISWSDASCEAVPASEVDRRGHEAALLPRNGAAESFVSFI